MSGRPLKPSNDNAPPKQPRIGQLWYDTTTRSLRKWNGEHWATEVRPGEVAQTVTASNPVTLLMKRVINELGYELVVKPEQVRVKKTSAYGMRFEFVDAAGASVLAGRDMILATHEQIQDLVDCDDLGVEISGRAFFAQHGVKLVALHTGLVYGGEAA